jgi:hypothetical protein
MSNATSKVSRDEQAAQIVAAVISAGCVVKSWGPDGDFTVGPYTKAVGPATFAMFGYGARVPAPYQAREGSALEVARVFVGSCVGAPRARQAALATPGRPAFSDAAGQVARERAAHARVCRSLHCKRCM